MRLLTAPHRGLTQLAFSPDGSRLAAGGNGPGVAVWGPGDPRPAVWLPAARPVTAVRFTPDGRSLLVAGGVLQPGYGLVQLDVDTGRPTPAGLRLPNANHLLGSAASDRLICCEWANRYQLVELGPAGDGPAWGVVRRVCPLPGSAWPLAPLPGGRVAVNRHKPTADELNVRHTFASPLVQVPADVVTGVVALDADRVAVLGPAGLAIWRPAKNRITPTVWPADAGRPTAVAAHPAGHTLLTTGSDGVARVWDTDGPAVRAAYDWKVGGLRAVAVAPDGLTAAVASATRVVAFDLE